VEKGKSYRVAYLENTNSIRLGLSNPFVIDDSVLPWIENMEATRTSSQSYNSTTTMQYLMQEQMNKLKSASNFNPLLTITPEPGKWEKMMEENRTKCMELEEEANAEMENTQKVQRQMEKGLIDDVGLNHDQVVDDLLNDTLMQGGLSAALDKKPLFLCRSRNICVASIFFSIVVGPDE